MHIFVVRSARDRGKHDTTRRYSKRDSRAIRRSTTHAPWNPSAVGRFRAVGWLFLEIVAKSGRYNRGRAVGQRSFTVRRERSVGCSSCLSTDGSYCREEREKKRETSVRTERRGADRRMTGIESHLCGRRWTVEYRRNVIVLFRRANRSVYPIDCRRARPGSNGTRRSFTSRRRQTSRTVRHHACQQRSCMNGCTYHRCISWRALSD